MIEIINLVFSNLEKVGLGAVLFLLAYIANMGLGAWKNVKLDGMNFDWHIVKESFIKFCVLTLSLALLSITISLLPIYATYVGVEIGAESMEIIDSVVIMASFVTAIIRYLVDAIKKITSILGNP